MKNKISLSVATATIVIVAVGLAAVPALNEQAHAANLVSGSKNKGKQGEISSDEKRNGKGGSSGGGCGTCP